MNAAATHRPHAMARDTLADRIDGALPQTQCTRCGCPDCRAYAEAIAAGAAGINQCPPGGAEGIARLARITGHTALPLNPAFGQEGPRHGAVIDEAWCIGCTLCLDACPTDAILGRSKRMHTVVPAHCTGCELCVSVCPVDCIAMVPATGTATGWEAWSFPQAASALQRYQAHTARRARQEGDGPAAVSTDASSGAAPPPARNALSPPDARAAPSGCAPADPKRAMIAAALQRARALRGG